MRKMLAVVCVAIFTFFVGCEESQEEHIRWENIKKTYRLNQASDMIHEIVYIKDSRTGLCFAYGWGGSANGGPALATVPCDAVPPELLTVVK